MIFQVLNKVTGGKPRGTRRSSGGRRLILKALVYILYCQTIQPVLHDENVNHIVLRTKLNIISLQETQKEIKLSLPELLKISAMF